jgi:hypothetical protein
MKRMKRLIRALLATHIFLAFVPPLSAATETYLYRVETVQAAPGKIVELMELYQTRAAMIEAGGDAAPFCMRHSQGDHWDLLLLYPMGSYTDYYGANRVNRRNKADASAPDLAHRIKQDVAWQEDTFVYGPALNTVKSAFADARFYHVEMLHALPAKQAELRKEREMENAYQKYLGRPESFIFVRDQGAAWDIISIDFYRDLQHYAGCAPNGTCAVAPTDQQLAAARAAGYSDPDQIGPYLRSIIAYHHDTLAVAVSPPTPK